MLRAYCMCEATYRLSAGGNRKLLKPYSAPHKVDLKANLHPTQSIQCMRAAPGSTWWRRGGPVHRSPSHTDYAVNSSRGVE
jgi:hypothetical protein